MVIIQLDSEQLFSLVKSAVSKALSENPNANVSTTETRHILNLNQLCDYTGLSKQTVYKKTSNGEIPHSKRGKRLFFEKASVDEWLLENRVGGKSEIEAKANNYLMTTRRRARTRL